MKGPAAHRSRMCAWTIRSSACLSIAFALLLNFGVANAQRRTENLITITIEPTRPQLTVGPGFGVVAEIKNISGSDVVYLWENYTALVVPPEVWDPSKRSPADPAKPQPWGSLWGFFPTDTRPEGGYICMALQPGDSYNVYWNTRALDQPSSLAVYLFRQIKSELYFMFFSPGPYKLSVIVQYWSTKSGKEQPYACHGPKRSDPASLNEFRTASQSVTLPVAAPQSVTMFGAAVGGLIAYSILPTGRRRLRSTADSSGSSVTRWVRVAAKESIGFLGAVLLSMIVTILLSRISETQFFVRVTVADLWGAIAVGFVANYAGAKVLDRILGPRQQRSDRGASVSARQSVEGAEADTRLVQPSTAEARQPASPPATGSGSRET